MWACVVAYHKWINPGTFFCGGGGGGGGGSGSGAVCVGVCLLFFTCFVLFCLCFHDDFIKFILILPL